LGGWGLACFLLKRKEAEKKGITDAGRIHNATWSRGNWWVLSDMKGLCIIGESGRAE